MEHTNLTGANLYKANLQNAPMLVANLTKANLQEANLMGADLQRARLWDADLKRANLQGANLSEAKMRKSDLQGANLQDSDLYGTVLIDADLRDSDLLNARLEKADLTNADLRGANLENTQLRNAIFDRADLRRVEMSFAHLEKTSFNDADMRGAEVYGTDMTMANLTSVQGLSDLRESYNRAGDGAMGRYLTFVIKKQELEKLIQGSFLYRLEGFFRIALFEVTCQYGMSPGRPLIILVCFILIFALIYMFAFVGLSKEDGIWKVWIPERVRFDLGKSEPELLIHTKAVNIWGDGIYFSILSATQIGWRDLNVGNWIARIQPREYTLSATGWVRTVSGLQSLISVYLLALSVLTYFGRPFDQF